MENRSYQTDIISRVHNEWSRGAKNVLLQLSTGGGKTVIFTDILKSWNGPSILIAHRSEILAQISTMLAQRGINHKAIVPKSLVRTLITLHRKATGRSFYNPQSQCVIASVDTLVKMRPEDNSWFKSVSLVVQDEAHHVLKNNKWGKAASLFPNARGLYPTATPERADGYGLGRHADGIIDVMVIGPPMRGLIEAGYLSEYRLIAGNSKIDLSDVPLSAAGDFSPPKLRAAVHKAKITGNIVAHYLRFAPGKLGVTFAVDIESAMEIAAEYRASGVSAEVITGKTPPLLRAEIMSRFRNREILQLVNVDILGEGVDVPAIEVVSMARPTHSYVTFAQQFGRALRPMPDKDRAIIIDHVGNVSRHRLPDRARVWTLDRRERRSRKTADDVIDTRICLNEDCMSVYEKTYKKCPFCGFGFTPTNRSAPEFVDGDLLELDEKVLAAMRGEVARIDGPAHPPQHLDHIAQRAVVNRHLERQRAQKELRDKIALWAGVQKARGCDDSEIYRRFYFAFGIDIMSAQTLNTNNAEELNGKIEANLCS